MLELKKRILKDGNWEVWSYEKVIRGVKSGFGIIVKNEAIGRCEYPIVYHDRTLGYDNPEMIPARLRERIRAKAAKGKLHSWAKDENLSLAFDKTS